MAKKEEPKPKENKTCGNCRFAGAHTFPCVKCEDYNKWEKEVEREKK